jgi:BASS family bile acid:Na+ symporter
MSATDIASISRFVQRRFIWLLIGSYLLAGVAPAAGLWVRSAVWSGVSLPMLMLGFLLFNAGLGVDLAALDHIRREPRGLACGLAANLLIPIAFTWLVMHTMRLWHNPDEVQNILVGLALVASMPIAGSSTAWSQNAGGNVALSLALVLGSTFLSPLTTPLALHSVGLMTTGDYSEDLHELAGATTGWFLAVSVIIPVAAGLAIRRLLDARRRGEARPGTSPRLKLANSLVLLILNYSNAAVSLPESVANPDADLLVVVLAVTLALCAVNFFSGWAMARLMSAGRSDTIALMFGLGMNNNGTGLVLASMALADHPRVLLPIIFYNLVQHLVAGCVDNVFGRAERET